MVQDLVLRPRVVRDRRERWPTPGGRVLGASLPAEIVGQIGPDLRRFVLPPRRRG